ncbi:MAG: mannitol dehydrogenase family protein [Alcaligenaceae bacterium]
MAKRLHPSNLTELAADVSRLHYPREQLKTGIVHLGLGAFVRAHMMAVNEAAIHARQDLCWGIVGVSLRHPDTRDALLPQDGLYTLALRDMDAQGCAQQRLHVLGCLRQILVAPENPASVIDAIVAPDTHIVSLTVTEKGYCHHPSQGTLQWDHPDIVHDLQHPETPHSAIGFLVRGLQRRYLTHALPLTLLSLDNLPSNGNILSTLVLSFAQKLDANLAKWIKATCTFPNSMVDRIVPKTTDFDRAEVALALGLQDAWPVVAETFCQWVIEDRFASERPAWELGGARFVDSAAAWETLKLRMVNGTHSAIAYLGALAGWHTVDQAMKQPMLVKFLDGLMREEIEATLPELPDLDIQAYRYSLLARFTNTALAHRTQQIAMDGSQKIPQRWLNTIKDLQAQKKSYVNLALCLAAWIQYLGGVDELGNTYSIQDPLNDLLQQTLADAARQASANLSPYHLALRQTEALFDVKQIFNEMAHDTDLIAAVAQQLDHLRNVGIKQALSTAAS